MNVMLDGYNLQTWQPAGIGNYAKTLAEILTNNGHAVSLLTQGHRPQYFYKSQSDVKKLAGALLRVMSGYTDAILRENVSLGSACNHQHTPYSAVDSVSNFYTLNGRTWKQAISRFFLTGRPTRIHTPLSTDILHVTSPLPIVSDSCPTVFTIHDMIPVDAPAFTLEHAGLFLRLAKFISNNADRVVAVSAHSAQRFCQLTGFDPHKITVTYQSVPSLAFEIGQKKEEFIYSDQGLLDILGVREREYLLFVGNIEPKKNLDLALEAISKSPDNIPLVVVGKPGWLWEKTMARAAHLFGDQVSEKVIFTGYLPDLFKYALMRRALALVFPSFEEGFGLPPLEAMTQSCPVLASNTSCIPEVCGDAAVYFDPHCVDELIAAIDKIRSSIDYTQELVAKGTLKASEFSQDSYWNRLRSVYSL